MKYFLRSGLAALIALLFINLAHAKNLTEMTGELCQKMKACGQEQLKQQELPAEMAKMMEGMFDGMCQAMVAPYVISTKDAGLESKAVACLESVNAMSCETLMKGDGSESKECQEFEKAAEKAYPDGYPNN